MDSGQPRPRVWVVPLVFALVGVSLPVQMIIKEHLGEPYPGLFQPAFSSVPRVGRTVKFRTIDFQVDGRAIDKMTLFPGPNPGRLKRLVEAMFPPNGDSPNVDDETRARLRSRSADALGIEPQTLTVTWDRRRFDPDTGRTTVEKKLSQYRIDLTGDSQ